MLDLRLRPIKESVLASCLPLVPADLHPDTITYAAFVIGLLIPLFSATGYRTLALLAWALNRLLDGLDGTVARKRGQQSSWGGFMDIVCDFTVYSLLPIGVNLSSPVSTALFDHLALPVLLAAFHINNVILFYLSAALPPPDAPQLTSLIMTPALIEGTESVVFFTVMLALPGRFVLVAWVMTLGVVVNVFQRCWIAKMAMTAASEKLKTG